MKAIQASINSKQSPKGPTPFEFTDYRAYLRAFYEAKRQGNPNYSMSNFVRRAGLGQNSRGYLKLIIDGRRNLTPHTLRRFIDALALTGREAIYLENLVFFNQAKTVQDKKYYFERLEASTHGKTDPQFEILRSQYHYLSNWYYVAVRELVGLGTFQEDATWIAAQLRNKITKKQASKAIEDLLKLELLKRNAQGKLIQSETLLRVQPEGLNVLVQKFHIEMMDRAKESLTEDDFDQRRTGSVTFGCKASLLPELIDELNHFRDAFNIKYGSEVTGLDSVVQVNFQVFQLTPLQKGKSQEKQS